MAARLGGGWRWTRAWTAGWSSDPVVRAMIAVFPLVRLLEVVASGPSTYPDSPTYRVPGSWLDLSLTSIGGHSVRPWGVTVWMALWPSDRAVVLAQAALAVVAWSVLALTLAAGIRRAAARRTIVLLVLTLASTAQVANWDLIILGESVSISSGILALAAAIRFQRAPTWRSGLVFLLPALWFAMTRPNIFPILLAWAVAFALVGLLRRQVLLPGVIAGLLVAFSLYSYVYNVRSDGAWQDRFGVSRTTVAYGYPVSENGPEAEAVLADLRRTDAPACMIPATPNDVSDHGTTAWVVRTAATCPEMDAWATAHWTRWWLGWLAGHPGRAVHIVRVELPNSLSTPVWADVTAAVPESVGSLYFGSPALPQAAVTTRNYRTQPLILWLAAVVALAWLGRRRWRGSAWTVDLILVAGAGGCLASAISSGLLIQTAPFEVGQEGAGAAVVLIATLVALVGFGLDRVLDERRGD
jgi:hypothetical protein